LFRRFFVGLLAVSLGCLASAQPNNAPEKDAAASGSPASQAASSGATSALPAASAASAPVRKWLSPFPRMYGRLTAKDVGLIINEDDPYSVQVGAELDAPGV
jgi:hypothetical protein